jgi:hypothetical protein
MLRQMKTKLYFWLAPIAGLLALTACKSTPQYTTRPNFLSTYNYLRKVDDTTWRYVNPALLGQCDKFMVSPVTVMFTEYNGKPITDEQRQRSADFVRQTVAQTLGDTYPIVTQAGSGVAEIRIAITEAYRTGGKLGLCLQGEILDNSRTQVAAVAKTELSEYYVPDWESKATARATVTEWAQRLRKTIGEAHTK